jgi:hypothetical protein
MLTGDFLSFMECTQQRCLFLCCCHHMIVAISEFEYISMLAVIQHETGLLQVLDHCDWSWLQLSMTGLIKMVIIKLNTQNNINELPSTQFRYSILISATPTFHCIKLPNHKCALWTGSADYISQQQIRRRSYSLQIQFRISGKGHAVV